jgi:hypothetical protein
MDRNDANQGNEDTREAEVHSQHAQENRDALAEQNRRTEATASDSANHPIGQQNAGGGNTGGTNATGSGSTGTGGMNATGGGTAGSGNASEDNTQAAANTSNAHDNMEALRDQNRRTEETTPDAVRRPIGEQNNNG